jgi:hypothetical protein
MQDRQMQKKSHRTVHSPLAIANHQNNDTKFDQSFNTKENGLTDDQEARTIAPTTR